MAMMTVRALPAIVLGQTDADCRLARRLDMHIAAIIDCGFFGSVKPRPTTMAVIKSLQAKPSEILEVS